MSNHTPNPIQIPLPIEGETFEIILTKGHVAIVDAIDADLANVKWSALEKGKGKVYAFRIEGNARIGTNKHYLMHRIILERMVGRALSRHELCDHKNMNGIDNRRSNLRVATASQNVSNQPAPSTNKSGFKGAHFNKKSGKWKAHITAKGIQYPLGYFDTVEEAHEAYRKAAIEHFGEFARFE